MLVAAALLDEGHLIDARIGKATQMFTHLVGRTDAATAALFCHRFAGFFKIGPNGGAPRLVFTKDMVMAQTTGEEAKPTPALAFPLTRTVQQPKPHPPPQPGLERPA